MRVLVFGSLNIDRTYWLKSIVRPGETVSASELRLYCGGKGLNQSVAFARAGSETRFAGAVGTDGKMLLDKLDENGIDRRMVQTLDGESGHAVIQVDENGQNSIIILAGANGRITREYIERVLDGSEAGDLIMLQNEINNLPLIIEKAHEKGLVTALNPSPYNEKIDACDLEKVDYLLINETEGAAIAGVTEPDGILSALHAAYPRMNVVLTLGESGSVYMDREGSTERFGIFPVKAVDTTAAGDTFTGYFMTELLGGAAPKDALRTAAAASAISVSREGAVPSIPTREEVKKMLGEDK